MLSNNERKEGRYLAKTTLILNNFLYNAGMLGFYRVLEQMGQDPEINGNTFSFELEAINQNFAENYIKVALDSFAADTWLFRNIINKNLVPIDNDDKQAIKDAQKKLNDQLSRFAKSRSYLSAYTVLQRLGIDVDIVGRAEDIRKEKDYQTQIIMFTAFKQLFDDPQVRREIVFKDIAYNQINAFWQNKAFLSNQEKTKEGYSFREIPCEQAFQIAFVQQLEGAPATKNGVSCIECGMPNIKKDIAMGWINDVGIDTTPARKGSYFWNFVPDTFLCPLCALIYACAPLGFTMVGREGFFINCSENFDILQKNNTSVRNLRLGDIRVMQNKGLQSLVNEMTLLMDQQKVEKEIDNIQVIQRYSVGDNPRYIFNVISRNKLLSMKQKKFGNAIEKLSKAFYQLAGSKTTIYLYDVCMDNYFSGQNQYQIIHSILYDSIAANKHAWFLWHILTMQVYGKGGNKMAEHNYSQCISAMMYGKELRKYLAEDADNKLRGYIYKLLNSLKTKNINDFLDVVLRMYVGMGREVPRVMINAFKDEETFLNLGYAYLMGLKGLDDKKTPQGSDSDVTVADNKNEEVAK